MARETMDKAVSYQTELENAKLSGQKQVNEKRRLTGVDTRQPYILDAVRA